MWCGWALCRVSTLRGRSARRKYMVFRRLNTKRIALWKKPPMLSMQAISLRNRIKQSKNQGQKSGFRSMNCSRCPSTITPSLWMLLVAAIRGKWSIKVCMCLPMSKCRPFFTSDPFPAPIILRSFLPLCMPLLGSSKKVTAKR